MRLAHSLGYPQSDLMLSSMSSTQFKELVAFFKLEREEKDQMDARLSDIRVGEFLRSKMKKQERDKSDG